MASVAVFAAPEDAVLSAVLAAVLAGPAGAPI